MALWVDQLRRLAECVDRQDAELRHTTDDRLSLLALSHDTDPAAALDQLRTGVDEQLSWLTSQHRSLLTDLASARLTALISDTERCLKGVSTQAGTLEEVLSGHGYKSYPQIVAAQKEEDGYRTEERGEVQSSPDQNNNAELLPLPPATPCIDSEAHDDGDTVKISAMLNIRSLPSVIVTDSSDHQAGDDSPLAVPPVFGGEGSSVTCCGGSPGALTSDSDLSLQVTPGVTRSHSSRPSSLGTAAAAAQTMPPPPPSTTKSRFGSTMTSSAESDVTPPATAVVSDYAQQLLRQLEQRSAAVTAASGGCYSARKARARRSDDTPPMPELSEYARRLLNL